MSHTKNVRPRCLGTSGSVRGDEDGPARGAARRWSTPSDRRPPTRRRRVPPASRAPARSEPAPGSLKSLTPGSSPVKIGGRKRRRCSSVPQRNNVLPTTWCMPTKSSWAHRWAPPPGELLGPPRPAATTPVAPSPRIRARSAPIRARSRTGARRTSAVRHARSVSVRASRCGSERNARTRPASILCSHRWPPNSASALARMIRCWSSAGQRIEQAWRSRPGRPAPRRAGSRIPSRCESVVAEVLDDPGDVVLGVRRDADVAPEDLARPLRERAADPRTVAAHAPALVHVAHEVRHPFGAVLGRRTPAGSGSGRTRCRRSTPRSCPRSAVRRRCSSTATPTCATAPGSGSSPQAGEMASKYQNGMMWNATVTPASLRRDHTGSK